MSDNIIANDQFAPDPATQWTLFDTHCHFDFLPFSADPASSWQRAQAAGVGALLIPAVKAAGFARLLALVASYPQCYAALGLHPLYIEEQGEAQLQQLQQQLSQQHSQVVAIGEIGLDLYRSEPQAEKQLWLLRQQLALAKKHDLPVILHCRKAHDQLLVELRKAALVRTGVIHGFSGSLVQAQAYLRLGYRIGVGGVITYPGASKTRRVMSQLPLSSLLLETDAPDMPLWGLQGQPNRPENIRLIFKALCSLRADEDPGYISATLWQNSKEMFNLAKIHRS